MSYRTKIRHSRGLLGRAPGQCPSWCCTDHAKHDRWGRYVWGEGPEQVAWRSAHHELVVAEIPNPGAGPDHQVYVSVAATDDLPDPGGLRTIDEPSAGPTTINIDGAECMTPEVARAVAEAIGEAIAVVTGSTS